MPSAIACLSAARKPELTEAQKTLAKKRQELTRVLEHLRVARGESSGKSPKLTKAGLT